MAKRRASGTDWFSVALVAALICWLMTPLLPQMVKAVMPLPSLESIHPIEGRFEYEGEWAPRRVPRYFVLTKEGRREFYCGYLGGRHSCFAKPAVFAGQRIKVWHSYAFGAVRIDVDPVPGQRVHPLDIEAHTFAGARANYSNPEYVRPQYFNSYGIFFLLALEAWLVWRVMNDRRGTSQ